MLRFGTGWHASIPNEFIRCPKSSDGAFRLFVVIVSFASPSSPQPFPTWNTLSRSVHCCRNSVSKWLKELEDGGWIGREQQLGSSGQFGHNFYTIYPDDRASAQKRKQFLSPSTISRDTVRPNTVRRDTVKCYTNDNQPEGKPNKNKTNTNVAAGAAGGAGGKNELDAGASSNEDMGKCFMIRWCQGHKQWFGVPYLQKDGEAVQARKVIRELECRPKDLLAYAFRMWINTTDYDEPDQEGFDPMFYQIKGSRSMRFFLSNLAEIANEQKKPFDCGIPVLEGEYRKLETDLAVGRPAPC